MQLDQDDVVIRLVCVVAAALSTIGDKDSSAAGIVKRAEKMEKFVHHGTQEEDKKEKKS